MQPLTISIVNYNAGEYLLKCLQSIEEVKAEAKINVVVLDNASVDDSIARAKEKYPSVKFVESKENLGFGRGQNVILKDLSTEYVLILNPDTELESGVLTKTLDYMEKNPGVGMLTCRIVLPDGTVDLTAHRGLPTPWASFLYFVLKNDSLYHLTGRNMTEAHEVDAISGSFMLTKKSVLEKIGLFDEDYFMYGEDVEFCLRAKRLGIKVDYFSQPQLTHLGQVSGSSRGAILGEYKGLKYIYQKHQPAWQYFVLRLLLKVGALLRLIIFKNQVYAEAFSLA